MTTSTKLVSMDRRRQSPLTSELKGFIDRAIVPALVRQYMVENKLAEPGARVAQSDSSTAVTLRVRP